MNLVDEPVRTRTFLLIEDKTKLRPIGGVEGQTKYEYLCRAESQIRCCNGSWDTLA